MTTSATASTTLFCCAQYPRRNRDRTLHETASPPVEFIRFLKAAARARRAGRKSRPRHRRQLCRSTNSPTSSTWIADHPRWTCSISPPTSAFGGSSMPSRASSPPSHAAKSDAEPSIPSTICRTRLNATSTLTTAIVGPSHGPLPPKRSSKNSLRSLHLPSESVH